MVNSSVAKVDPKIRGFIWDKNGVILDKLGVILDNFGVIVAQVGAVWAHVGIRNVTHKSTKNRILPSKTQNTPKNP